jgi:hypothetical protein
MSSHRTVRMYAVESYGLLTKGNLYEVVEGGKDCYKVKVQGKAFYAPKYLFSFEKPIVRQYFDDDDYDNEGDY